MSISPHRYPVASAVLIGIGLALCGCQPTQDPAQAGFFSGWGNIASGVYDQRIVVKQQELSNAQMLQQQLQRRANEAVTGAEQSAVKLDEWRRKVDSMRRETRRLEQRLAAGSSRLGAQDPRVVEAKLRLDAVRQKLEKASLETEQNRAAVHAERELLERDIRTTRDMIAIMSAGIE